MFYPYIPAYSTRMLLTSDYLNTDSLYSDSSEYTPLSSVTTDSLIKTISNSLTNTVITETSTTPIMSSLGIIGSETIVKPVASNFNNNIYLSPLSRPLDTDNLVTSINLNYTKPIIAVYNDLNSDYDTQQTIIKYIRMKMLDKWLHRDFKNLLGYFVVGSDNKVKLISNISQYDPNSIKKDSKSTIEKKIDFIGDKYVTKRFISKLMYKYIKETNSEWVTVPKADYYIKKILGKRLKKLLLKEIKK